MESEAILREDIGFYMGDILCALLSPCMGFRMNIGNMSYSQYYGYSSPIQDGHRILIWACVKATTQLHVEDRSSHGSEPNMA